MKGVSMNEGQELERIQTEEASLNSNSDFAILRKLNRNKDDPQEKLRTDGYLRAVEDSVEQNDNSFDGIINNTVQDEKSDGIKESENKKAQIALELFKSFYAAEEEHQDYYLKNPEAFEKEMIESGRRK